jgi:hypothetical protein
MAVMEENVKHHSQYELGKAKERLRHKVNVIQGCIKQPGFYWLSPQGSIV